MTCPDYSTAPLRCKNSEFSHSCLRISKYCIQTKLCICEIEIHFASVAKRNVAPTLWNKALLMVLSLSGLFHCSALFHSLCLFPLIPFKIQTESMWDGRRANNKRDFFLILRDILYQHGVLGQKMKHDFFFYLSASVCCSLIPTLKSTGYMQSSFPSLISCGSSSNIFAGSWTSIT